MVANKSKAFCQQVKYTSLYFQEANLSLNLFAQAIHLQCVRSSCQQLPSMLGLYTNMLISSINPILKVLILEALYISRSSILQNKKRISKKGDPYSIPTFTQRFADSLPYTIKVVVQLIINALTQQTIYIRTCYQCRTSNSLVASTILKALEISSNSIEATFFPMSQTLQICLIRSSRAVSTNLLGLAPIYLLGSSQ